MIDCVYYINAISIHTAPTTLRPVLVSMVDSVATVRVDSGGFYTSLNVRCIPACRVVNQQPTIASMRVFQVRTGNISYYPVISKYLQVISDTIQHYQVLIR